MEQQSSGKIFCFKNKFLDFSETKKFSTESLLTFRELQSLVSYKRVSYKKIHVYKKFIKLYKIIQNYVKSYKKVKMSK